MGTNLLILHSGDIKNKERKYSEFANKARIFSENTQRMEK